MEILTISGGSGLWRGADARRKNSVLPIMAASVLCRGTVTLTDVPHLSDVEASARILQSVGCKVLLENGRAVITPPEFPGSAVPEPLMRAMRSSLFYLAPLLARTGRADIYTPGGCRLGARPIDMHLSGLEKMGRISRRRTRRAGGHCPGRPCGRGYLPALPQCGRHRDASHGGGRSQRRRCCAARPWSRR
ncbi:MAG: hypothetical protein ACLRRT_07165 [Ruthenibacterium lactatiformans]